VNRERSVTVEVLITGVLLEAFSQNTTSLDDALLQRRRIPRAYGHCVRPRTMGRSSSIRRLQRWDRSAVSQSSKVKPVTERKSGVGLRSFR
jgi:hypothetical protein